MKEVPAFIFYKSNYEVINDYNDEEAGKIFKALFLYSLTKEIPKDFSQGMLTCFKVFKGEIDRNEKKYREKIEYQQEYNRTRRRKSSAEPSEAEAEEKPKARGKPAREPTAEKTATGAVRQSKLTDLQARFLTAFKAYCPDKTINCKLADFPDVDLEALMIAIRQSPQFLMIKNKNEALNGLRWYLENADKIIAGNYIKYADEKPKSQGTRQNHTKEELDEHFKNIKEIEN